MKWLFINTDYPAFLEWLYRHQPGLARAPYEEQLQARLATRFGIADFYSYNLRAVGQDALDVFANNEILQKRWAAEHGLRVTPSPCWRLRWRHGICPWPRRVRNRAWLLDILAAQVKAYRPDILYSMAIETIGSDFLRRVKGYYRLALVQHAAMSPAHDVRGYDLMLSSLPNLVAQFRAQGLRTRYFPLAFEPRVLADLNGMPRTFDLVFVGGLSGIQHAPGARLLERLCAELNVRVWGYGAEGLPPGSSVRECYQGPLWGRDMYQVLRQAKIVLNRHGPIAGPYANNMRLYEATGVGTLLLTEQKRNLVELFEPGGEVVAYTNAEECAALVRHYLARDAERERIARAGQARTLRRYTYTHRARELIEIVRACL